MPEQNQLHLVATRQSDAAAANEPRLDAKTDIVDGFLRLAALPTFPLDRLSRYEHTLWRQARQIVFTLESLRRRKQQPRRSRFSILIPAPRAQSPSRIINVPTRDGNIERVHPAALSDQLSRHHSDR